MPFIASRLGPLVMTFEDLAFTWFVWVAGAPIVVPSEACWVWSRFVPGAG